MAYDDYSVGASSIRTAPPSANNSNKSTAPQNLTSAQRTQGSIFDKAVGNFSSLTLATRIPADNTRVVINPPKQPAQPAQSAQPIPIGNMLNGKFGNLTNKSNIMNFSNTATAMNSERVSQNGMADFVKIPNEMNTDQLSQESGEELAKKALAVNFMKQGETFVA